MTFLVEKIRKPQNKKVWPKLNDVGKVVYQGIEVKGEHVHVDHYSKPANKIVISNVPPYFPNEILRPIIARKGVIVGKIKPIPLSSTKYRHIQSLRRSVTVILDRPTENLADTVDIFYEGQNHQIYLSTNQPRCFICNEMGHISKYCSYKMLFKVIYNVTVINVFNM